MNGLIEITMGGEVRTLKFGNYALMSYNVLTATEAGESKKLDIDYQMIDFVIRSSLIQTRDKCFGRSEYFCLRSSRR